MENTTVLKHILEERRSIFPKNYTGEDLPEHVITEVLRMATLAPNHKKTKPWRFKVFKGKEKDRLGAELQLRYKECTPDEKFLQKKHDDISDKISRASAVISIVVEYSGLVPDWEEVAATAMAVQNMYLTCTAYRIGCYWSSPIWANELKEVLKIEDNQQCLGLFYMGTV